MASQGPTISKQELRQTRPVDFKRRMAQQSSMLDQLLAQGLRREPFVKPVNFKER
jgi:hypothetical protein